MQRFAAWTAHTTLAYTFARGGGRAMREYPVPRERVELVNANFDLD